MRGNLGQIIQHVLDLDFSNTLDKRLERFVLLTLVHIPTGESFHDFRDSLRRNSAHRQSIRACVMPPLTAQHNLKMRDCVISRVTAYTIEPEIRNMVLSTGVEAATHFDVQILNRIVQSVTLLGET